MAKTIKTTLYTPKELWRMFWTKFFWPRRKKCSEWLEFLQGRLEYSIVNKLLIDKFCKEGKISDDVTDEMELSIKQAIQEAVDETKKVMTTPIWEDEYHE